jgi:hypothetical protein
MSHLTNSHFILAGIIEGANDGKGRGRQVIAGAAPYSIFFDSKIKLASLSQWPEHAILFL